MMALVDGISLDSRIRSARIAKTTPQIGTIKKPLAVTILTGSDRSKMTESCPKSSVGSDPADQIIFPAQQDQSPRNTELTGLTDRVPATCSGLLRLPLDLSCLTLLLLLHKESERARGSVGVSEN